MSSMESKTPRQIPQRLKSKEWRLSHLYKIIDKYGNLVIFDRNKVQRWYADNFWYRNLILKSRQLGFTTDACIDMLDDVIFTPNFTAVIIAHEKEAVVKIFKKVRLAWDEFPKELKDYLGITASTDSKNELSFNNKSSIRVALSSRADTVNRLHISEFAKISKKYPEKAKEIITGSIPSVPMDGRIDIESTSEGPIGEFYEMFMHAWRNPPQTKLDFRPFFFPWFDDPYYQISDNIPLPTEMYEYAHKHKLSIPQATWYFVNKRSLKSEMVREYPTTPEEAFSAGSEMMFNAEALDRLVLKQGEKVGQWEYFSDPLPGHSYGIGVDVAEGIGQDHSAIVVWDFTPIKPVVVARYFSNLISPQQLAFEAKSAGRLYKMAIIAVERNNHGYATLAKLAEIYPEELIFRMEDEAKSDEKMKGTDVIRFGWHTNLATKPKMLYDIRDAVNDELVEICDKVIVDDMRSYPKEDVGRTRPIDGQTQHWDALIACAIGFQMRNHIKRYRDEYGEIKVDSPTTTTNINSVI